MRTNGHDCIPNIVCDRVSLEVMAILRRCRRTVRERHLGCHKKGWGRLLRSTYHPKWTTATLEVHLYLTLCEFTRSFPRLRRTPRLGRHSRGSVAMMLGGHNTYKSETASCARTQRGTNSNRGISYRRFANRCFTTSIQRSQTAHRNSKLALGHILRLADSHGTKK